MKLNRYHGVFAPNSAHRALVTRAGRGKSRASAARADVRRPAERRTAMRWAQRLKGVFGIDIETYAACGGTMRIIACIEDPVVIGDPRAPGGQSAPGARTAVAAGSGAACAGLKRFTQRHQFNLSGSNSPPLGASTFANVFGFDTARLAAGLFIHVRPDAVGSMPGQGIGWVDGCPRRQFGGDEGAIRGDRGEVARISAARPVAPTHTSPGTRLLKG